MKTTKNPISRDQAIFQFFDKLSKNKQYTFINVYGGNALLVNSEKDVFLSYIQYLKKDIKLSVDNIKNIVNGWDVVENRIITETESFVNEENDQIYTNVVPVKLDDHYIRYSLDLNFLKKCKKFWSSEHPKYHGIGINKGIIAATDAYKMIYNYTSVRGDYFLNANTLNDILKCSPVEIYFYKNSDNKVVYEFYDKQGYLHYCIQYIDIKPYDYSTIIPDYDGYINIYNKVEVTDTINYFKSFKDKNSSVRLSNENNFLLLNYKNASRMVKIDDYYNNFKQVFNVKLFADVLMACENSIKIYFSENEKKPIRINDEKYYFLLMPTIEL